MAGSSEHLTTDISTPVSMEAYAGVESMDIRTSSDRDLPSLNVGRYQDGRFKNGFSCVISYGGVVLFTTASLTTTLGFLKETWLGRSFINFVHPRDRSNFVSQITVGLADPNANSTLLCRIRRYRSIRTGFGVKNKKMKYTPFLLKLTFKNISDEESKVRYLVIEATPFFSMFKTPYELISTSVPFVIKHAATGTIEYAVEPDSVSYLGYLPPHVTDKDALQLYHPEDVHYLRQVYEAIVNERALPTSKVYRMLTLNGDYIKLETEWTSFINAWSPKLVYVTGKHHVIEDLANLDMFYTPELDEPSRNSEEEGELSASV